MNVKPEHILLPIDLAACPPEVFSFINQMMAGREAKITLLHVVTLNVRAPENRLYRETTENSEKTLRLLADKYFAKDLERDVRVRYGRAAEEIVSEASESKASLIVLTSRDNARRFRLFRVPVLEPVIENAPCPVSVLRVRNRIDCSLCPAPAAIIPLADAPAPFASWPVLPHPAPHSAAGH